MHVASDEEIKGWSLRAALGVLAVATVATAFVAEILVGSLEVFAEKAGLSEFFVAAVIVAIVGNAAEHGGAVIVAYREARARRRDRARVGGAGRSLPHPGGCAPLLAHRSALAELPARRDRRSRRFRRVHDDRALQRPVQPRAWRAPPCRVRRGRRRVLPRRRPLTCPSLETLRAEIAGVPAFVVPDGPRVPVVGLTFRVGRADETAATSGLSHLVEHLALPATTATSFDFNGTVDTLFTSLFASGDLDDLQRLRRHDERIAPEPTPRSDSRPSAGSSSRRRARGALEAHVRLSPSASAPWDTVCPATSSTDCGGRTGRRSPSGLRSGSRRPAPLSGSPERRSTTSASGSNSPAEDSREEPPLPRESTTSRHRPSTPRAPASAVCLSLLADRRAATRIALDIYADALRERLRYELALSYSIEHDLHALTADVSHLCVTADVADEHIATWLEEATTILEQLAGDGPSRRGARADEGPLPALRPRRASSHGLGGDVRGVGARRAPGPAPRRPRGRVRRRDHRGRRASTRRHARVAPRSRPRRRPRCRRASRSTPSSRRARLDGRRHRPASRATACGDISATWSSSRRRTVSRA